MGLSQLRSNIRSRIKMKMEAAKMPPGYTGDAPDTDPVVVAAMADGVLKTQELAGMTPAQRRTAYRLRREAQVAKKAARGSERERRDGGGPLGWAKSAASRARGVVDLGKKATDTIKGATQIARDLRGGRPPPLPDVAAVVPPELTAVTGNAFEIAAAKQVAAAGGARAIGAFRNRVKLDPVEIVSEQAAAVAETHGVDYARAAEVYDAQVGVDTPFQVPAVSSPAAQVGAKAVNAVAGDALDSTLAAIGASPLSEGGDDPSAPPPVVDTKVLMAAAAVLLLLLLKG